MESSTKTLMQHSLESKGMHMEAEAPSSLLMKEEGSIKKS